MLILRVGDNPNPSADLRDPAQKFLTPKPAKFRGIFTSLGAIFSKGVKSSRRSLYLIRGTAQTDFGLHSGYFFATLLLHVAALVLILRFVHFTVDADTRRDEDYDLSSAKIFYSVPKQEKHRSIPKIAPTGPGSVPGRGEPAPEEPARSSSAFHKSLTVVSNPKRPDNNHQTIIQAAAPPDLKIKEDLHLPNIVIGNPMQQPKSPTIALNWKAPAPKQGAAKAVKNSAAPEVANEKWMDLTVVGNIVPNAGLPVAPPQQPMRRPNGPGGGPAAAAIPETGQTSSGGSGAKDLIVIGTNPDENATQLALPLGNRYGAFSLSADGPGAGSVAGTGKTGSGAGSEGGGTGGNGSSGIGSGTTGGGGGSHSSDTGTVSISGGDGGGSADTTLRTEAVAESMVYPIENPSNLRHNSMIVSSGSVGGGGLAVYKALQCGKIYTVFLSMPGGNWTMEFCKQGDAPQPTAAGNASVIHMEVGVVPPDAMQVFDFKRLPVSEINQHKQIIIRGVIDADGSVKDAKVYFGLQPEMDEAARIAFSKWKFKPALQSGKPVPIEFLVGIPPLAQ